MFNIGNARNAGNILKCDWFIEMFYDEHVGEYDETRNSMPAMVATAEEVATGLTSMLRGMAEEARTLRLAEDYVRHGQNTTDLARDLVEVQSLDPLTNIIFFGSK